MAAQAHGRPSFPNSCSGTNTNQPLLTENSPHPMEMPFEDLIEPKSSPSEVKMPRSPFLPVLLSCFVIVGCQHGASNATSSREIHSRPVVARLTNREAIAKLLPPEVQLSTVAQACSPDHKITVEDELIRVKAHVSDDGKLRDANGKPIEFFHLTGDWGNPPANYQQIWDEQNRRLEELRRTHTVITLTGNPSGIPFP
jgi:hypothetical protein